MLSCTSHSMLIFQSHLASPSHLSWSLPHLTSTVYFHAAFPSRVAAVATLLIDALCSYLHHSSKFNLCLASISVAVEVAVEHLPG